MVKTKSLDTLRQLDAFTFVLRIMVKIESLGAFTYVLRITVKTESSDTLRQLGTFTKSSKFANKIFL